MKPIIVLGSGLSGMITALALASVNIATIIVESKSVDDIAFFNDIRTTAFTLSSKEFFQRINIWKEIEEVTSKILEIYVLDNKAPEMLHFIASGGVDIETLGYIVQNTELKAILLNLIKNNNLITLIDQCPYQIMASYEDGCEISLQNDKRIKSELLIICDGWSSPSHQYFSHRIEKYYGQTAFAFNVSHEKYHQNIAIEHFLPYGPFAILPLRNQHHSSIVWTLEETLAKTLAILPITELEYLVQKNFGAFLGKIKLISHIAHFPLKACLAEEYFYQRIVLVADSAHIIHPLAGQGLNQGIKDIDALVSSLNSLGINNIALQHYQNSRQYDNLAMYMITDNLNRIFLCRSKSAIMLRTKGLELINRIPAIKSWFMHYASGKR